MYSFNTCRKTFSTILIILFIISINSKLALSQTTVFQDNFDGYIVGQQIACQSSGVWQTWTNNPCDATEDAIVSDLYSFNGQNSIVIKQYNDIVRDHGLLTDGIAEINFQVFIPNGKAGYFNTLANFDPPTYEWAMQVFFNSPGTGTLDAAGRNAASFSYPQNRWFPVKVVANLLVDSCQFWIDGSLIHQWQYSKGTFGSTIAKTMDGTDFYGYSTNDEMYIDDYNIVYTPIDSITVSSTSTGGDWNSPSTWVGGIIPDQSRDVEIVAGATITLSSDITRNARTVVNGNLNCGIFNFIGNGDFILAANATLQIGSELGISLTGATGNIQVSGTRSFNQFANYTYNGNNAQITGNGLPTSVTSLTINNSAGVTLSTSTSISGTLNLNSGSLITNSNILSLGTSITNLGTLTYSSGSVIGNFNRWVSNSASILFPVGTSSTKYTPVELNNIAGSGTFTASAIAGEHPNAAGTNVLQMYWKLTNGGITSTDLTFNYLDADVVGDETLFEIGRYDGSWYYPFPIILNTVANTARINGVNSFSDWTLGEPGALPVELSSFTSKMVSDGVKLSWTTQTEVNNYGFEVERRSIQSQNSDEKWETLDFVEGNGNSNSPKYYSYLDRGINYGRYLYRLKQVDNDGTFEYSNQIEVFVDNIPNDFVLEQNYPNPFNPSTIVEYSIPSESFVELKVYDVLGNEVATLVDENQQGGVYRVDFIADNLPSGLYFARISANNFTQVIKMTLLK